MDETRDEIDDHGSRYLGHHSELTGGPWSLTFHWGEVDGVTECIGLDVRSFRETRDEDGRITSRRTFGGAKAEPVSTTLMRDLPVGRLVREGREDIRHLADEGRRTRGLDLEPDVFERDADRRRRWTSRDLSAVAAVYLDALDAKRPPRQAVAEAFDVSGSMASKLIRKARDVELLGETTQGKPGGGMREDDR